MNENQKTDTKSIDSKKECSSSDNKSADLTIGRATHGLIKPSFSRFYSELLLAKKFDPNLLSTSISFKYFSRFYD